MIAVDLNFSNFESLRIEDHLSKALFDDSMANLKAVGSEHGREGIPVRRCLKNLT